MLKKKGIALVWNQLLAIIIGVIVVLGVANILFGGKIFENTRKALKDLWQYTIFGQEEFVPYEEEFTSEEEIVDKSVRALKFVIEKVANPNTELKKPDDVPYCNEINEEQGLVANVCCEIRYVNPAGPSIYYVHKEMSKRECENEPNGIIVDPTENKCSALFSRKKQPLCIDCENPIEKCKVKGFELPQQFRVGFSVSDWAKSWIHGARDPKYLIFYESFPEGENAAWQISEFSFWYDVVLFGAVLNVIPVGFGAIKKGMSAIKTFSTSKIFGRTAKSLQQESTEIIAKEAGEEIAERAGKEAVAHLSNIFRIGGYQRYIKARGLFHRLLKINLPEKKAEEIAESYYKRVQWLKFRDGEITPVEIKKYFTDKEMTKLSKKGIDEVWDDVQENVLKDLDDSLKILVKREIDDMAVRSYANVPELARIENQESIKQFFLGTDILTEGGKLDVGTLDNILRKGATEKTFGEIDEAALQALDKRSIDYANALLKEEGEIAWNELLGITDSKIINAITNDFDSFITRTITEFDTQHIINLMGGNVKWTPIFKMRGGPIRTFLGSAGAAGWDLTKITTKSRVLRYLVALKIGDILATAEMENEKFKGHGIDSLVVFRPLYRASLSRPYHVENINKFYLNLVKEGGENTRFFLASPCKTDLTLTKTMCSCNLNKGVYVLSNLQPVKAGSVVAPLNAIDVVYLFDELSQDEKKNTVEECFRKTTCVYGMFCEKCMTTLLKDPDYIRIFLEYVYTIAERAKEFMEEYNIKNMHPNNILLPSDHSISNDPRINDYDVLSQVISIEDSIARIMVENNLTTKEKFTDYYINYLNSDGVYSQDFIIRIVSKMHTINIGYITYYKGERATFYSDFFDIKEGSLIWNITKQTYFHYYKFLDEQGRAVDKSKAIKECDVANIGGGTEGILELTTKKQGKITIPCVTIEPDMGSYEDYNEENNFCFSGNHLLVNIAKWATFGIAMAIDVGVGMTTGFIIEVPVTILTGAGSAYASKLLDKSTEWPNH